MEKRDHKEKNSVNKYIEKEYKQQLGLYFQVTLKLSTSETLIFYLENTNIWDFGHKQWYNSEEFKMENKLWVNICVSPSGNKEMFSTIGICIL